MPLMEGGGAISHVAFKKCPSPLSLYICKCYVDVELSNIARHRVILGTIRVITGQKWKGFQHCQS